MKNFLFLTFTLALASLGIASAQDKTPDILLPDFDEARVIGGLSNNGKYGVASVSPLEAGFSYTIGAVFYDLTGSTPVATELTQNNSAVGAFDVTDDGRLVVGTLNQQPAVCRFDGASWKWSVLPIPDKKFTILREDFTTGAATPEVVTLNGGEIRAVTPDGKYAVGLARCNEWELVEWAVMWDLSTGKIVDVDSPTKGGDGLEYNQTRYTQLSDDGRYILCRNAFSYEGDVVYVYDRTNKKAIYIDRVQNPDGSFSPRQEGYFGLEMDGISKSLTSDGRYVGGGIRNNDGIIPFVFDVQKEALTVLDDGIHDDATCWSVTKDGMPLGATPAVNPYADAIAYYDDFQFPFSALYQGVYGLDMEGRYGIDNTGKPTLVSEDTRTIVFVTGQSDSYVLKLKEDLSDALSRVNLMSGWTVSPPDGTSMAAISRVTIAFENPIEVGADKASLVELLDSDGRLVANPMTSGGLQADGHRLVISFRARELKEGESYTLRVSEGVCWVMGRPSDVNPLIEVSYEGRANVPVKVAQVSPASGSAMASLDLADNPVQVSFDVPVKMNENFSGTPIAHLYVEGSEESYASLSMDVDLYTNTLIIYPATTIFLYKGAEYEIKVPAGVVCDLSGQGPSEAFSITYSGSYVPQIGDEQYLFRSSCDDFSNFLFYDGDQGEPTEEYLNFGFTQDTTPWWVVMDEEIQDMAFASHSSYDDKRQADDWLMIRQLHIPSGVASYLSFQGQSYRKAKEDWLKIYVYEKSEALNFLSAAEVALIREKGKVVFHEKLSPGNSESKIDGEWTDYTVDLSEFGGKNIYICFVNENKDQSMVMIDNIEVGKEVKAILTVTGAGNVVRQDSYPVEGMITVKSELDEYSSLKMELKDSEGNVVSTIEESFAAPLKTDDIYRFRFPELLPLRIGEENVYTVNYTLDSDEMSFYGSVRNLAFQTTKRVLIEEQTGKDCQWCPLGILALENLLDKFPGQIVPVILHTYGTDPKGAGVTDYSAVVFGGNTSAPIGRINRHPGLYSPMYSDDNGKYHYTAADVPGSDPVWQDVVAQELAEPALVDLSLQPVASSKVGHVEFLATVKSAITLSDQNVRVLGVLLEDNIFDRQTSALHSFDDEALGEFGKGGKYGASAFLYYFNHVARGYWGQSVNGSGRLIPSTLEAGKEYEVKIDYSIPAIVEDVDEIRMAVILIDENTGLVVNAAMMAPDLSGVEDIVADEALTAPVITKQGTEIIVSAPGDVEVALYSLDGRLLKTVRGNGTVAVSVDGYRGLGIVRAVSAGNVCAKKMIF